MQSLVVCEECVVIDGTESKWIGQEVQTGWRRQRAVAEGLRAAMKEGQSGGYCGRIRCHF